MGLKTDYRTRFMAPIHELGCGNFGAVFEALREPDTAAARAGAPDTVAVKVLPREQMTLESGGLRQLGKEIDIWSEVQHSLSVVSFEGVFQEGASDVRLVMERCGGPTLEAGLPLPAAEVRDVAVQVLEAVAQCHARKILHRDIKPANFMRASDAPGAPLKMLDFGLSTYFYGRPKTTRCGAPLYMAPELVAGSYGPPADVWSAGVLLFACAVGRTPWEPADGRELSKPALFSRIACPKFLPDLFRGSDEWLAFPPGYRDLVERLMARDPSKRLTAVQALQHPWLERQRPPPRARERVGRGGEDDGCLVQRLQAFGGLGRALRALLVELYRSLPAEARGSPPLSEGPGPAPRAAAVTSVELERWLRGQGYAVSSEEAFFLADSVSLGLEARGALGQDEIGAAALDWPALYDTEPWHDGVDRLALRLGSSAGMGYQVTGAALRGLLAQHGVSEDDLRRLGGGASAGRQVWTGKPLQDVLVGAWAAESCSPGLYPSRRPPPAPRTP